MLTKKLTVLVAAALLGCAITSQAALADDWHGHNGDHHGGHEWHHDRGWYDRHHMPYPYYVAPEPPPVVYAEPPMSPGISLFFPIR